MSIDDFYTFWESKGAEVTTSRHTSDSCHYFVRSWELIKFRPSPYFDMVRNFGIAMVFTRKEIESLNLADLDEQYMARQLTITFC